MVEYSWDVTNEVSNLPVKTKKNRSGRHQATRSSIAETNKVLDRSAGTFLMGRKILEVELRLQKSTSEHSRKVGEKLTPYKIG